MHRAGVCNMLQVNERLASAKTDLGHPTLGAFHHYWRTRQTESGLPGRQHIDPAAIRSLLPWLFMVDVEQQARRPVFRFRLAGTEIVRLFAFEITGLTVEGAFPDSAPELTADYARDIAARYPTHVKRPLPVPGKRHRLIDQLICPLAADGDLIDMLIGIVAPVSNRRLASDSQSAA